MFGSVTLTGPGGVGKTRLALQVAADLHAAFVDGVWFVDLAPIRDPELVVTTIAQTLRITEGSNRPPVEQLQSYLRDKQLPLVLDNFEHVVAAGPHVTTLLATAPGLTVLVTSRMVLRLSGEHVFPVPPLALPDPQEVPSISALNDSDAVTLFYACARATKLDFVLTPANAVVVAGIRQRSHAFLAGD